MKNLIKRDVSSWIVYQDRELIVVNKPVTIPVQDDQSKDESLLSIMETEIGKPLFLINRIDRPVSGLVLIAKNPKVQTKFSSYRITKQYLAITHKNDKLEAGKLQHYHSKSGRNKKAYISDVEKPNFKSVNLSIEEIHPLENYDILKISINSGRFHQIRAQLAHIGSPIKGDVKYGARRANKERSIMLHAYEYEISELNKSFCCLPDLDSTLWKAAQSILSQNENCQDFLLK